MVLWKQKDNLFLFILKKIENEIKFYCMKNKFHKKKTFENLVHFFCSYRSNVKANEKSGVDDLKSTSTVTATTYIS